MDLNTKLSDRKVEGIPGLVWDMFDHLVQLQIIPVKPDFCTIDFFDEVSSCQK